jgi:tetratricopeptide (TPR) repeat protein
MPPAGLIHDQKIHLHDRLAGEVLRRDVGVLMKRAAGPAAHNYAGLTLRAQRDLDGAVAEFRQAIALDPKFAPAHSNLGRAFSQQRRYKDASAAYREVIKLKPDDLEALDTEDRYNGARAAALGGCGQGEDAARLDDQERARLRGQALDWLRADLALRAKQVASGRSQDQAAAQQALEHWLKDTPFAGVRGEALAKLPEAERQAWRQLWADVADALARAQDQAATEKKSDMK